LWGAIGWYWLLLASGLVEKEVEARKEAERELQELEQQLKNPPQTA
jgi:hypothetical protein